MGIVSMNEEMLDLIAGSGTLPTMPQVVVRFLEISADENYEVNDLIAVLATDPGIASELLRLSNSSLFGVTRQVTSLQQSVTLLGMGRVRTLVLGRYLVERVDSGAKTGVEFDFSYYWRRSLGTAVLAAKFADQLAPRHREEAFIGGLMSDVGVVVMLQAMPDNYASVAAEYAPSRGENFLEQELAALGITHADVSSLLMDKWKLPPIVVEAVRQHHSDTLKEHKEDNTHTLARILGAAGLIAKLLCESPDKEVAQTCATAMEIAGLNALAFQNILQDLDSGISELAKLLNVDIIESKVYSRVCEIVAGMLADQTSAV